VRVRPVGTADLPENELGYDAVDAVLWLNADAADLERSRKRAVLERGSPGRAPRRLPDERAGAIERWRRCCRSS
jgi:hypothetical protein